MMRMRSHEAGVALFLCIFALMLLSGIAFGLMLLCNTETRINANFRDSQQSYFAALAGLEEVRERLTMSNSPPHAVAAPAALPGAANSVVYVVNPAAGETVDPAQVTLSDLPNPYFDDELCHENFSVLGLTNPGIGVRCDSASSVPGVYAPFIAADGPFHGTAAALGYKWVRITRKANNTADPLFVDGGANPSTWNSPVCWNGANQVLLPAGYADCNLPPLGQPNIYEPVHVLTALANVRGRRLLQMEVAVDPPIITNAAVDSLDHVTLNGQLTVNGYEYCSCDCTWTGSGTHRTLTCLDRPGKICDRSRYAIYAANTVDTPSTSEVIVAGTGNPSGSEPIARNQPWPFDVAGLVERFKYGADTVDVTDSPYNYTCTGNPPSCGTRAGQQFGVPPAFPPSPVDAPASDPTLGPRHDQVTYVPGSLQLTASSVGSGTLVVDGDLDVHGGLQFYGLIIVKGVLSFTGGGSQPTNIYGAVLAGQESRVDTVLGGGADIQYDMCALPPRRTDRPPVVISRREISY